MKTPAHVESYTVDAENRVVNAQCSLSGAKCPHVSWNDCVNCTVLRNFCAKPITPDVLAKILFHRFDEARAKQGPRG